MHLKMNLSDADMAQLLQQAQRHEPAAFERLHELYAGRVYRYVWYRVRDPEQVQDLTADVFERLIGKIATFRIPAQDTVATFSGWLFRIAHNHLYDVHERRDRDQAVLVSTGEMCDRPDETIELSALAEDREREAAVRTAIAQLPAEQQEVVILRFWEQLSHAEVASLMGRSEGAIRALQHRALKALRSALAPENVEASR